jgi:hypothetical protein
MYIWDSLGVMAYLAGYHSIQDTAAARQYSHGLTVMMRAELGLPIIIGCVEVGSAVTATVVAGPVVVEVMVIINLGCNAILTVGSSAFVVTRNIKAVINNALENFITGRKES